MPKPANNGNLIIRRVFYDIERRRKFLQKATNAAWSTVYQYMEEMPPHGSGTASCLHVMQELIRRLVEDEKQHPSDPRMSGELAYATVNFYRQLQGEVEPSGDVADELNDINKDIADALVLLKRRDFGALCGKEMRDFWQLMMNAQTRIQRLTARAEGGLKDYEEGFTGVPIERERPRRLA